MKIVFATYVDNQKEIGYPVDFLLQNIPGLVVYSSDMENHDCLMLQNIESTVIWQKIRNQNDISVAQNLCIDHAFANHKADFVVWVQADTFITKEGFELINSVCIPGNEDKSFALNLRHLRLFHVCHTDYFGVTIFGKNHNERFIGDGAYTDYTGSKPHSRLGSSSASIDIGYLTIDQCRKHLAQHKKTWGHGKDFSDLPEKEFVQQYLKRNDVFGFIEEGDVYHDLIVKMGLKAEYKRMKVVSSSLLTSKFGRYTAV